LETGACCQVGLSRRGKSGHGRQRNIGVAHGCLKRFPEEGLRRCGFAERQALHRIAPDFSIP